MNGSPWKARKILEGRYRFLNQERRLPDPVDWRLECWPEVAHLWRFHLHYQEYLLDLVAEGLAAGQSRYLQRAWQLVAQWIENNELTDSRVLLDAWHPYCISRRLPVWVLLCSASAASEEPRERVLCSTFQQTRFLEKHLEWDIPGNHLLENAKALVLVGTFLNCPDADRWLRKGARILRQQIAQQILRHGEHFERSPMYHAQVLEAVLDVRDAVGTIMPKLADYCQEAAAKMAGFLREILHPDGQIPSLGDASLSDGPPAAYLLERVAGAKPKGGPIACRPACVSHAGPGGQIVGDYWTYRHGKDFLILDAGPLGPDHLPAHAHADLLSFEASLGGQRLVVDSGVFGYADDGMRRYCRSSSAHNVVQIDGQDQSDVWSKFRMGYRGWPNRPDCGQTNDFYWASASHNAYRRLGVPQVGRWMACRAGGPWLCVDWAEGKGRHKLTSWLHLHPDVDLRKVSDDEVSLSIDGTDLRLRYLTAGQLVVTTGWYCPEFGRRLRCPVLRWTTTASLPSICGWCLVWGKNDGQAVLEQTDSGDVLLRWRQQDEELQLRPVEKPLFVCPTRPALR